MNCLGRILLTACCAGAFASAGQEQTMSLEELATAAEEWVQDNVDPEALAALPEMDRERAGRLLRDLQKELDARYVIDLAALRSSVRAILPLLEQHEETLPYALWLKAQIDYLEVAEHFRSVAPVAKGPEPAPNPTPAAEREIWIEKISKRAWPEAAREHVPALKKAFSAEGIPSELVWIAEVESSFDPRARSPKGAAGLFQLMPATAQRFGLRTWPFDQRLKPEPSAKAAAQYIRSLHGQFKDWRLVLAAYNAGEGTVSKLLSKHKARSFESIATYLPAETQMFVPRVEAMLLKREGVKVGQLQSPATVPKPNKAG